MEATSDRDEGLADCATEERSHGTPDQRPSTRLGRTDKRYDQRKPTKRDGGRESGKIYDARQAPNITRSPHKDTAPAQLIHGECYIFAHVTCRFVLHCFNEQSQVGRPASAASPTEQDGFWYCRRKRGKEEDGDTRVPQLLSVLTKPTQRYGRGRTLSFSTTVLVSVDVSLARFRR